MKRWHDIAPLATLIALLLIAAVILTGCISIPIPNKISLTDFLL